MNLLISDFDGTLDGFNEKEGKILNLTANIETIGRFIENGNYFVIASSGSTDFLSFCMKESSIPYHYLIGANGIIGNNELHQNYRYDASFGYKKEDGIYRIIDYLASKSVNIPKENIFTVGDGQSDYEMIKLWNGFQIGNSSILKEVSLGKYDDVYKLVEDIENNKVKRKKL